MNFVLDASVALSWCFEDESGDDALHILDILRSSEAITASLWPLEVANGLLTAQRRGRIEPARATRLGRMLLSLPIVVDPVARGRAFGATTALARAHGLTLYDAAYLELAVRLGLPLATLDGPLVEAARAEGVERIGGS